MWSIEDKVPRDRSARFIEAFVDSLDLEIMGFEHTVPAPTGRPPYDPYDLVKLYVWGYLNRVRSSRRLMRECRRNIELWFFINRLVLDFPTSRTSARHIRAAQEDIHEWTGCDCCDADAALSRRK